MPIFLCPSPTAPLLAQAANIASARQRRVSPEYLDEERERIRSYGRSFGKEYSDIYVERQALEAHRRRLGEFNYEEFTARADGYADSGEREREHHLRVVGELNHLLGQLNVG